MQRALNSNCFRYSVGGRRKFCKRNYSTKIEPQMNTDLHRLFHFLSVNIRVHPWLIQARFLLDVALNCAYATRNNSESAFAVSAVRCLSARRCASTISGVDSWG